MATVDEVSDKTKVADEFILRSVLVARTISHSFASLAREILFLPLEHKIHIFSPACIILYLL